MTDPDTNTPIEATGTPDHTSTGARLAKELASNTTETEVNPEAAIEATHKELAELIRSVPEDYIIPFEGAAEGSNLLEIRLMSQPASVRDGQQMGESHLRVGFQAGLKDSLDAPYAIMTQEERGSGNPWGDVINNAGAVVHKKTIVQTFFTSPTTAESRTGRYTFGPARLEEAQNQAEASKPTQPATPEEIARIKLMLDNGTVYKPSDPSDQKAISDLLTTEPK